MGPAVCYSPQDIYEEGAEIRVERNTMTVGAGKIMPVMPRAVSRTPPNTYIDSLPVCVRVCLSPRVTRTHIYLGA